MSGRRGQSAPPVMSGTTMICSLHRRSKHTPLDQSPDSDITATSANQDSPFKLLNE